MSSSGYVEALVPLEDLRANRVNVLVIGSGPAGVALAEFLYHVYPDVSVGIVERGGVLSLTHFSNVFRDQDRRGEIIKHYGAFPWKGDFERRGMLLFALGGRGIVAGAHLRRFYPEDMDPNLWKNTEWPIPTLDLDRYFTMAELVRHVSPGEAESPAQTWVMGELDHFKPHPPPWGVDVRFKGRGFDSSAERLWEMLHDDLLRARDNDAKRRLFVATHSLATKLEVKQGRATGVICYDLRSPNNPPAVLDADTVVLAWIPTEVRELTHGRPDATSRPRIGGAIPRSVSHSVILCTERHLIT